MSTLYVVTNARTGRSLEGLRRMPLAEALTVADAAHALGYAGRILAVTTEPGHAEHGVEHAPFTVWTRTADGAEEEHPYGLTTAEEQRRILAGLIAEGVHVSAFRGL